MVWNLPNKQRKLGMMQTEGTSPKVCRYSGKLTLELWIVWQVLVIILENGKRRAGKIDRYYEEFDDPDYEVWKLSYGH